MFSEIQHYRILQRIGGGGFADVYLAKDERLRREVAIKVLQTSFAEQGEYRRFFEQEAQIVASLEHLAVVPIYDYGEIEGQLYLVMRLMRGGTLAERLTRRQNAFTLEEVIVLLERLAPTLDAIHARGIVHRDLKPSNILYDETDLPFIADFGIARMQQATTHYTQTGVSFGTFQYSSPEQIKAERDLDGRSDIYSLGVILYYLLTGAFPYNADTPMGWMYQHLEAPIPDIRALNKRLPVGVKTVLEGMLAKSREARYATAGAVLQDLRRAATGERLSAPHVYAATTPLARGGAPERAVVPPRQPAWLWVALGIMTVLVVGAVALGVGLVAGGRLNQPNETALAPSVSEVITPVASPVESVVTEVSLAAADPNGGNAEILTIASTSTRVTIDPTATAAPPTATPTPPPATPSAVATPTLRARVTFRNAAGDLFTWINVRAEPSMDAPILAEIESESDSFNLLDLDWSDGWVWIELDDGTRGYVSAEFVVLTP